jgi:hypothetical protein
MRKQTILMVMALTLSLIIGAQLVTASLSSNIIPAKVKIWPHWLWLREDYCEDYGHCDLHEDCGHFGHCEKSFHVIAFITFPKGYDVRDINASSVTLQVLGSNVPLVKYHVWRKMFTAMFDRASVIRLLCLLMPHMSPCTSQKVTLIVTGNLYDGQAFEGKDTIRVFFTGH